MVGKKMDYFLEVHIQHFYKLFKEIVGKEDIKLEPSELAGMIGPIILHKGEEAIYKIMI
ncbi:D-serine dehydratase [Bacillus thuringiensis]|uniref:D-serine dehydratase n=1 Tax=Bacillus thuringiensis TaxID=1428 RepID=UPI002DB64921|nr:D-serine dehydratase [Bacillus thuringiensis]MEC3267993.1 D-serine dehydratase [Bacillus thuringiensis]MED2072798.1 D-serine dehydratase [Bacillus thuringiensis]MED2223801.1 D-serine dehydratase [Bacillus thuringiensis]MED2282716.1 D-serine dehydratase [Bacillus thuringiensis]MED2824177.1 D-serine dehydratase [Bacillus thuringiensis]